MYDKNLDGLVPDSAYWDKGTADSRGESIYIWKAYWNDGRVDSLYEANLRNGEWKYQTTVNTTDIKVNHEGNIWIIESKTMDGKVDKETIYFDGDSLAITNNDGTNIYVMKKDTLFRPRPRENFIITMDEKDTNTCYEKRNYEGTWMTLNRYETAFKNGQVLLTKTIIEDGLDSKTVTFFLNQRKSSTTSIHRNTRPKFHLQNCKHFDLLGRPAKGKYTVNFLKWSSTKK